MSKEFYKQLKYRWDKKTHSNNETVPEYKFKAVVGGEEGVGKTSLINRWINGVFLGSPRVTIGVGFHTHHMIIDGKKVSLIMWDLGGQLHFQQMGVFRSYIKGAKGGFLAFDLTNPITLEKLSQWLELFKKEIALENLILIGTKADLVNDRKVTKENVEKFMETYKIDIYIETSALNGKNVNLAFEILIKRLLKPKKEIFSFNFSSILYNQIKKQQNNNKNFF
ncbi:MAG: Rab family GTPase [Candidatus Hodarchaeota archaeon]